MKRFVFLCASAAALAMSNPALAAKVFVLDGVTLQGGGTLTGTFTTNDAFTDLQAIDITASAGTYHGYTFAEFKYNNVNLVDWESLPTGFRVSTSGYAQQLSLLFSALNAIGGTIQFGGNSYESQSGAGNRLVTGGSVLPAAVPEPATWAMLIAGFGMVGGAMRIRSRKVVFA